MEDSKAASLLSLLVHAWLIELQSGWCVTCRKSCKMLDATKPALRPAMLMAFGDSILLMCQATAVAVQIAHVKRKRNTACSDLGHAHTLCKIRMQKDCHDVALEVSKTFMVHGVTFLPAM